MNMKRKLIARCRDLGAMLLDAGDVLRVDLPAGFRLAGQSLHYVDLYTRGWRREDAYREILAELADGIEPCDDPDCDTCNEAASFDQIRLWYPGERLA